MRKTWDDLYARFDARDVEIAKQFAPECVKNIRCVSFNGQQRLLAPDACSIEDWTFDLQGWLAMCSLCEAAKEGREKSEKERAARLERARLIDPYDLPRRALTPDEKAYVQSVWRKNASRPKD